MRGGLRGSLTGLVIYLFYFRLVMDTWAGCFFLLKITFCVIKGQEFFEGVFLPPFPFFFIFFVLGGLS